MAILKLDVEWDLAASAEDVGYLKPNPEPFIYVADKLDVPVRNILYVGNHYDYDILGANKVGMKTAHLSRRRRNGTHADFTFASYKELHKQLIDAGYI
jgi:putative hydrolase of the HAD superfamily